jgi:transposase
VNLRHIVRKPAGQRGFAVIPRRWAAERTFTWITARRRLARDQECVLQRAVCDANMLP